MFNVRIIKASDNMDDRICLPDISQELIAQSLSFGCTLDQTSNIGKFKRCIDHLFRLEDLYKVLHSLIRHLYDADIWADRRKWIILSQYLTVGNCIE